MKCASHVLLGPTTIIHFPDLLVCGLEKIDAKSHKLSIGSKDVYLLCEGVVNLTEFLLYAIQFDKI